MEDHSQCILPASLGTKFLARRVQERSFTATSFREPISQLVDSDTVDPSWDGELMDNAFVFARREHHVHGHRGSSSEVSRDTRTSELIKQVRKSPSDSRRVWC